MTRRSAGTGKKRGRSAGTGKKRRSAPARRNGHARRRGSERRAGSGRSRPRTRTRIAARGHDRAPGTGTARRVAAAGPGRAPATARRPAADARAQHLGTDAAVAAAHVTARGPAAEGQGLAIAGAAAAATAAAAKRAAPARTVTAWAATSHARRSPHPPTWPSAPALAQTHSLPCARWLSPKTPRRRCDCGSCSSCKRGTWCWTSRPRVRPQPPAKRSVRCTWAASLPAWSPRRPCGRCSTARCLSSLHTS
mmetsp:Transcript_2413/g.6224  ORF Transcript_2413/g.6224 Transcript_2413/m.6224 type:complete len:251 (+) Transcript_2413:518-1270(+)